MADDPDDPDRDAIVKRRNRLIAAALTGLVSGTAQACACLSAAVDGGRYYDAGRDAGTSADASSSDAATRDASVASDASADDASVSSDAATEDASVSVDGGPMPCLSPLPPDGGAPVPCLTIAPSDGGPEA